MRPAVLDIVDDRVEREAVDDSTGTRWRGFRTRKVRRLEIAGVEGQRLQVVRHALVLKREPDAPSIGAPDAQWGVIVAVSS